MSGGGEAREIELLSAWFCPYAQRAWIALEEKCPGKYIVTNVIEVDSPGVFAKSPLLLENNPKAQVPVILDRRGGTEAIVCESLACVEYADRTMGEDGNGDNSLVPMSRDAEARSWVDRFDGEISSNFYALLLRRDEEGRARAASDMLGGLRAFAAECKGPFFFGEEFTIVDVAIAPWVVGVRMDVLRFYRNFEVPRTGEYAKYWEWAAAVSRRPSFVATAWKDAGAMIDLYLPYAEGRTYTSV